MGAGAEGTWDDAAITDPTARGSMVSLLKGLLKQNLGGLAFDAAGNALTVKWAVANVAASQTDANVVTAVASRKLRVLFVSTQDAGTTTAITFNSKGGGAGTAISPLYQQAVNSGLNLNFNSAGWFQTNSGEALTVTTGTGTATGILVGYVEVP
jgi:hypothetical protein